MYIERPVTTDCSAEVDHMKEIQVRRLGDTSRIAQEMEQAQLGCIRRALSGFDAAEQSVIVSQLCRRYGGKA